MTACKFNGRENPRILKDRHMDICQCPEDDPARGCLPCPEPHCRVCGRAHSAGTCAECLAATRDDLHGIAAMCNSLPAEVEHRGVNGEAMVLLGPAADPEARGHLEASVKAGRVPADYLDHADGEQHPLFVLGTWDMVWRDALEHDEGAKLTISGAVDYLDRQMTYMAGYEHVPFEDFARDLRECRTHLERVLHDGEQVETGAPCPECDRPLVKDYGKSEVFDRWVCPSRRCGAWYLDHEYRRWVSDDYRANADRLTAPDIEAQYDVPAGSVRGWASAGKVHKRGKDESGRQLYDVADVLRQRKGSAA